MREIINYDTIKYVIAHQTLFASMSIFVNILYREYIIQVENKERIKYFIIALSTFVVCAFLYLDFATLDMHLVGYFSISFILTILKLNTINFRFHSVLSIVTMVLFFNYLFFEPHEFLRYNIKYLVILLMIGIFYKSKSSSKKKLLFWLGFGHLYIFFEMVTLEVGRIEMIQFFVASVLFNLINLKILTFNHRTNQLYIESHHFSYKDFLTGINNARALIEKCEEIVNKNQGLHTLIFFDLNSLKSINDEYGHRHGDEAIKMFAYVLTQIFIDGFVSRKSGDEFCVILSGNENRAKTYVEKLVNHLKTSHIIVPTGDKITLSVSVGLTEITKQYDLKRIFDSVDQAMYEQKNANPML